MVKMLNITIPDDAHVLLEKIKAKKGFANNAEALTWIIKVVSEIVENEESE